MTLFNSLWIENQSPFSHDRRWLNQLKERVWSRIKFDVNMIPSPEALLRYWKRSCWVVTVWKQATANQITYPPLDVYGWKYNDEDLTGTVMKMSQM